MTRVTTTVVKAPRVERYLIGTMVLIGASYIATLTYNVAGTQVESQLSPAQLGQQGEAANVASRALVQFNAQGTIAAVTVLLVVLLWVRFGRKLWAYKKATVVPAILLMMTISGCGPAKLEQFAEVADHETAFLVPLESGSENQEKFNSKEYLQQNLIASKRVSLPLRERTTGRWWWNYEWIPTARLITVARTPQHREWIKTDGEKSAQVLSAQSSEGTKFTMGAVVSALVTEDDSALFRSHFKNVSLEQILDTTVRGYCQERLAALFNQLSVDQCQNQKSAVFEQTEKEAIAEFHKVGITILYFGNHGGLDYLNPEVQKAIDSEYLQKLEKQIAERKLVAQKTRNLTKNVVAKAEAQAATALQEASEAMQFVTNIEIAMMQAQSRLKLAEKVKGSLPETILPTTGGSNLLMNMK